MAAVIIIAAPELPVPPYPDCMECHSNSDPHNFYCRTLALGAVISREFGEFIERDRDLISALPVALIAAFAFALWRSNRIAERVIALPERVLGWKPTIALEVGLRRTVAYFKENGC